MYYTIPIVGSLSWVSLTSSTPEHKKSLFLLPVPLSGKEKRKPGLHCSTSIPSLPAPCLWLCANSLCPTRQLNESPLPRPQRPLANSIDLDSCLRRRVDQQTDAMSALLLLGSLLGSLESTLLVRAVGTRRIVLGWPCGSLSQAWPLPVTSWSR